MTELLEKGLNVESAVNDYINNLGATTIWDKLDDNPPIQLIINNQKFGDIIVFEDNRNAPRYLKYKLDVKSAHRNNENKLICFIAFSSSNNFEGQFFCASNENDVEDSYLLNASSVKKYINKISDDKIHYGPSGDPGHYFIIDDFENKIKLIDFIKENVLKNMEK